MRPKETELKLLNDVNNLSARAPNFNPTFHSRTLQNWVSCHNGDICTSQSQSPWTGENRKWVCLGRVHESAMTKKLHQNSQMRVTESTTILQGRQSSRITTLSAAPG